MLCLLGVMLSLLCLVSPAPHTTPHTKRSACSASSLLKETIEVLRNISSKGSSEIVPLNNMMEAGGNAATYLEGFIEALKNSKEREVIVNLQKIQSCTAWMSALKEHHWEAVEDYDFFNNLEQFLRFLGHKVLPEEGNKLSFEGVQGTCPVCQKT